VQPEGDHRARGCAAAISRLSAEMQVPLIAKETGGGMSRQSASTLRACGVAALDVGGRGGTSFAAVEGMRAGGLGDASHARLGELFRDWGVPTPVAVLAAVPEGLPVIATGGIRTGLDAAKAIALGATAVGIGRPLVQAALRGSGEVERWLQRFLAELRAAMLLTGARTVADLRRNRPIVLGDTRRWIRQLADSTKASDRI
jgi:isopentenyl-diphosphate delta-isomerase